MWILITICSCITLVTVLAFCLCWGKKTQKNEWLGLDGMVTQKNPDENVNHLPSANAHSVPDGVISCAVIDTTDAAAKRPVVTNNPRRSLPDIPSEGVRINSVVVTYEPNGDNSSDLYATVEPYQNATNPKASTLPNGIESRPSVSHHSSISQTDDGPYARVRDHPYDELRKAENPYARVNSHDSQNGDENNSSDATPRTCLSRNERSTNPQVDHEPIAPPRSRRTSEQSGLGVDISAASAVAGGIAASQELPYMTPPIAQTNFSGDSQDSSKGYTSISVREPLANIRAQTKDLHKVPVDADPHYSTVSDDSDEMYTTIPDANNSIYTSGSETYAQIQPPQLTVAAEINVAAPSSSVQLEEDEIGDGLYEPAPQPPKHVTHTHSRQASSSSSMGTLGSPKPEKRQANSPLPPPPSTSPDLLHLSSPLKSIDDMYAKVHKTKKKYSEVVASGLNDEATANQKTLPQNEYSPRKSTSSSSSTEERKQVTETLESSSVNNTTSRDNRISCDHNYETLRKYNDPGYELLKNRDGNSLEPGYDTIVGPASLVSSDPGYEVLKSHSEADPNYEELLHRTVSTSDSVGYSTIGNDSSSLNDSSVAKCNSLPNDGYSVVNKQRKKDLSHEEAKSRNSSSYESDPKDLSIDEPNYESMNSESLSEHNYAALKSTGSESDPNYESMNHSDPNYESVKYLDVSLDEPPYERLHEDDSNKTDSDVPGYEKVNSKRDDEKCSEIESGHNNCNEQHTSLLNSENIDPGYETVNTNKNCVSMN